MQSSNSSARAASEADARRRRGPADRRRSVHPGGGWGKTPPPKMFEFFLKNKFNLKKKFFSLAIFFHHFSWGVGNTSGFGMQLSFGLRSDRY